MDVITQSQITVYNIWCTAYNGHHRVFMVEYKVHSVMRTVHNIVFVVYIMPSGVYTMNRSEPCRVMDKQIQGLITTGGALSGQSKKYEDLSRFPNVGECN